MKAGRGVGGLSLALLALLVLPAHSGATDSDLKFAYAFKVPASHGYSIVAVAANQSADGRGSIVLFVERGRESAAYAAPAQLSATGIEANLGPLGKISLSVVPSGRNQQLPAGCGKRRTVSYEPPSYRGTFEFHGEEGYTDAVSVSPRDFSRFFALIACAGAGSGEFGGSELPGARLLLHGADVGAHLHLRANENHPGARVRFEIEASEKRGSIRISRESTFWLTSSAFSFDRSLNSATLAPASPFSGHATFSRNAAPANRWAGNLAVDLPGRSNLPLTGPDLTASLAHACFQGEGAGSRADCGFR